MLKKGLSLWESSPCPQGLSSETWTLWEQECTGPVEIYHGQGAQFPPPTHKLIEL